MQTGLANERMHASRGRELGVKKCLVLCFLGPAILIFTSSVVQACSFHSGVCPACESLLPTVAECVRSTDVLFIGERLSDPPKEGTRITSFRIRTLLKGKPLVDGAEEKIEIWCDGKPEPETEYLMFARRDPEGGLYCRYPVQLTPTLKRYVLSILATPAERPDRLQFYVRYLASTDPVVATDVENELRSATWQELVALRSSLNSDRIRKLCKDPDLSMKRLALYWTLLGICGDQAGIEYLEQIVKSPPEVENAPTILIPATISYLALTGDHGVDLVEKTMITGEPVAPFRAYSTFRALNYHSENTNLFSKARVGLAMRKLLQCHEISDLALYELIRLKDWSAIDEAVQLFHSEPAKDYPVRPAILSYLRACPRPEAKKHLAELLRVGNGDGSNFQDQ